MSDLSGWTSLPNLHPAVVHFPVALLPVAILFDLLGLAMRRQEWLERAALALYAAAAAGALLAQWAGERAADSLVGVAAAVEPRIAEHSDWAHYATWALGVLVALRVSVTLWGRESIRTALRAVVVVLALGALGLLAYAADLGGALVYRHAVGVELPAPPLAPMPATPAAETEDDESAASRLVSLEDGTLRWDPLPGDLEALGEFLRPAAGFPGDSVSAMADEPAGMGLILEVEGATLLLLPGDFGDVRVEANLELIDFEGTLGVAHHVAGEDARGLATLSTAGTAVLSDLRGGELEILDDGEADVPVGLFTLAVSSSGRHLKGLLDGKTVTHGHVSPGPDGGCGLFLDGRGSLRVVSLSVTPLADH